MDPEPSDAPLSTGLSRRRFLKWGGLGGLSWAWGREAIASELHDFGVRYNDPLQPLIFRVERAWDLLHLDVELINFMPVRTRGIRPIIENPSGFRDEFSLHIASYATDGFVVLHLGGQHIAEQSIWDRPLLKDDKSDAGSGKKQPTYFVERDASKADSGLDDIDFLGRDRRFVLGNNGKTKIPRPDSQMLQGLSGAWMAGNSQLVFRIPQVETPLPLDFDEIIDACLRSGQLVVHDRVLADGPDETFFTGSDPESIRLGRPYLGHHDTLHPRTQIEFPSMLYLSPYNNAEWKARGGALDRKRTELWSLDLANPDPGAGRGGRPREQRAQGHLFAFDTDTSSPRWPLEGEYKFDEESSQLKYNPGERPKTSLYQATRELLVGQMGEDNGDIVAQKFRLSALGASAKLKYRPLIVPDLRESTADVNRDKRKETVEVGEKPKDERTPKESEPRKIEANPRLRDGRADNLIADKENKRPGFLTEWDQRTESGRDYFFKEAFAGYWFPFQLPGESVTVTERTFSVIDPRTKAEIPISLQESRKQEQVGEVEGNLVAFLVARKFGVVKQRVREFGGPESGDFDDVGAMIARALGLRKIEVLVDETPTLSNQGTPSDSRISDRIAKGDDGTFVTGGTGKDAAREIFWPRVAVADRAAANPGGGAEISKRRLTPYRFPVRLTFIDGRTLETRMPMLFSYDLGLGGSLYGIAPDLLRSVPIHANMPLAAAQSAAAMNPEELGVDDAENFSSALKSIINLPEIGFGEISLPDGTSKDLLGSLQLSGITTALVGGIRERTLNYVAEQREAIRDWIELKEVAVDGSLKQFRDLLRAKPEELGFGEGLVEAKAQEICAWVAWGKDGHVGVTAAQAARRLGEAVELAVKLERVKELIAGLKTVNLVQVSAENAKDRITDVVNSLKEATSDNIRDKLPKIQAQWVASLGDIWHRREWDEWFAQLFIKVTPKSWHGPAASLLQRELLRMLMSGDEVLSSLKIGGKILPPISEWASKLTICQVPEAIQTTFKTNLKEFEATISRDKQDGLRRLKKAIEEGLPDELWLRQRVQMLIEDWPLAERAGQDGIKRLGDELGNVIGEAGQHLAHLATHSDAGMESTRKFFKEVAANVEEVAEELASVEKAVREWVKDRSGKIVATIPKDGTQIPEVLKHVLQCDPDQSLRHFQNLLHECGGRLSVEIEEALLELAELAVEKVKQVEQISKNLEGWQPGMDAALQAQYRRLARQARNHQEELMVEIRRVVSPWRQTLHSLLDVNQMDLVPPVLAGRVCLWLEELVPDRSLRNSMQEEINGQLEKIEKRLAEAWGVEVGPLKDALNVLAGHLGRFSEKTKAEIIAFRDKVEGDAASAFVGIDRVERILAKNILSKGRSEAKKAIRKHLKEIGADFGDSIEKKLEKAWKDIRSPLTELQGKFGQSLDAANLNGLQGEYKKKWDRVEAKLKDIVPEISVEIGKRKAHLEGAALHLANKASISLGCPSLIKSFRDQSAKAEYFVEEIRFTVKTLEKDLAEAGEKVANDVRAALGIPGIETLRTRIPNVPDAAEIRHTETYVRNGLRGLEKEAAGAFAEIASAAKTMAQKSGISDAKSKVKYLSRDLGAIADSVVQRERVIRDGWGKAVKEGQDIVKDYKETLNKKADELQRKASDFLPGSDSKLFGVIPLKDILAAVATPDKAPQLLANHLPDRVEQHYVWENEMTGKDLKIVRFEPVNERSKFRIVNTVTAWTPKPGQPVRPPEVFTRGHLDGFVLGIAGMLNLHFKSVAFTAKNGRFDFKPSLGRTQRQGGTNDAGGDAKGGDGFMTFTGPLELVDTVRQKLSTFLDSKDGPIVRVEQGRIFAGYSFTLPDMTFGAVSVQNLSIGTQLSLPLDKGSLAMRFNLSEFDNQFRVTVLCFAGGGFLAVQVSPDRKLCSVEGSIEFGGSLALNLGVASGELSLMAGAYFKMAHDKTTFSGYLRAVGRVRLLGILEISILFYMALFYRRGGGDTEFWGQCTVAVSVKLGFFKKTVRMTLERKFKGAKSNSNAEGDWGASNGSAVGRLWRYDDRYSIASNGNDGLPKAVPPPSPARVDSEDTNPKNHFENEFKSPASWNDYWKSFAA